VARATELIDMFPATAKSRRCKLQENSMRHAVRYLIPLLFVIFGLLFHFSRIDRTYYDSRVDARVYAKKCQENGRNKGGFVQYVFVVNQKAYEGEYLDLDCRNRAIGGLVSVKYVFESPDKNSPALNADVGPLGALLWAAFAYVGLVLISHLISPPTKRIATQRRH